MNDRETLVRALENALSGDPQRMKEAEGVLLQEELRGANRGECPACERTLEDCRCLDDHTTCALPFPILRAPRRVTTELTFPKTPTMGFEIFPNE